MKAYLLSLVDSANIADQWDYGFLKDFLEDNGFDIQECSELTPDETAIVVVPARHHKGLELKLDYELSKILHVVLFLMGDEEAEFDVDKIQHPSIHIWVQNPHMGKHDKYHKLGTGQPQHTRDILKAIVTPINKGLDIYFAGQVTHKRRTELTDVLVDMELTNKNIRVVRTKGFTQGETPLDYTMSMVSAKIAPAPSGAVIPDSFRLFEALECMAIPIADQKTASGEVMEYWDWLFAEAVPFPKIVDWDRLFGLVPELLEEWPHNMHKQTAWWIKYKRDFKLEVMGQLNG